MDFVRDDTHMMSMKIVQFSRLPFSFTLLLYLISVTYVVQSSSTTLTLDIQFQRNPSPFPNYSQSIKRKLNPCMTILCYQVFPFRLGFIFSINSLILHGFPLTSFCLAKPNLVPRVILKN